MKSVQKQKMIKKKKNQKPRGLHVSEKIKISVPTSISFSNIISKNKMMGQTELLQ